MAKESDARKKPTHEEDGKLVKKKEKKDADAEMEAESEAKKAQDDGRDDSEARDEDLEEHHREKDAEAEDEDESETEKDAEDEDLSDMSEEEKGMYRKLRMKVKRKMHKGEGSGVNPEESAEQSDSPDHTTSPGQGTPSPAQDIMVPPSDVEGKRTQETPMSKPSAKSASEMNLQKSPLYTNLSGQIVDMQKALDSKLSAVEKSMNDRLVNMQKNLDKFYSGSFYKAASENVNPEAIQKETISQQIEKGKVRMRT